MYLKYLNIPFKHLGSGWEGADCYGLIRLYYKTELGIDLPDVFYTPNWASVSPEFALNSIIEIGFEEITSPIHNAVVLLKEKGAYKHLGLIIKAPYTIMHTNFNGTVCEYKPNIVTAGNKFFKYRG